MCLSSGALGGSAPVADRSMATAGASVPQKVETFRNFAGQLAAQLTEQLCQEYEREVAVMVNDVNTYRNELCRCAELVGLQLGRERQLHGMLEKVADHQTNIASSAQNLAYQSPSSRDLHDLVDQVSEQYAGVMNSALMGVSEAHNVAAQHAQTAKQLQEPMISAENEFARICQLLAAPEIEARLPEPMVEAPPSPKISWRSPAPSANRQADPSLWRSAASTADASLWRAAGNGDAAPLGHSKRLHSGMQTPPYGGRTPPYGGWAPTPPQSLQMPPNAAMLPPQGPPHAEMMPPQGGPPQGLPPHAGMGPPMNMRQPMAHRPFTGGPPAQPMYAPGGHGAMMSIGTTAFR